MRIKNSNKNKILMLNKNFILTKNLLLDTILRIKLEIQVIIKYLMQFKERDDENIPLSFHFNEIEKLKIETNKKINFLLKKIKNYNIIIDLKISNSPKKEILITRLTNLDISQENIIDTIKDIEFNPNILTTDVFYFFKIKNYHTESIENDDEI